MFINTVFAAGTGSIIGLKLDQESQKAIQQIKDNGKVGKLIATVATLGSIQ